MDLQTIFSWFKRGCKPTEAQFKATFLSFRHKDDQVPMEDVSGLSYALATKSNVGHTHTLAEISDYDGGDKEVLNAMVAQNAEQLGTFTKTIGMYYIQLDDVLLYRYEHDEDTDTDVLNEVEPDGKVVYSAYDVDEHLHIYLYNVPNMEFQDVTDRPVDKTIYTSDLDTLVTRQLENGVYSVVYINSDQEGNTFGDAYTLTVGDGSISSRVLECRTGWAQTVLVDENYQWQWHRYSYNGHTHQMSDVEGLGTALGGKAAANHNHDGVYQPAGSYAAADHTHSQYLTQHQDISGKQDKTDNSLLTTVKTIVGAINELWNKFADYALSNHNHDGVYQPAGSYAAADHTHSQYLTQHQDISGKQDKTDNSLPTTSKTIIGAITELWNKFADYLKGIQHVTYAQLVTLRNNGELKPGQKYRITDFVTTTRSRYYNEDETDYRSAGHAFDLIVTADSSATLNKMAKATPHAGDTYFADADLSRWRIMYDLNNDQTRYDWADPENGKGVIYDMIDEWENHCRYDFKNIQYKRYKVTAVSNAALNDLIDTYALSSQGLTLDYDDYIWAYTFNVYGFTYTRDDENEDISVETDYQNSEDRSLNKREYLRAYASYNDGEDYTSDYNNSICHDNDIPAYYSMDEDLMDGENCYWKGYQQLNNIVFLHSAPDYDYSYDSGQLLYLLFYYTEPAYGNKFGVNCFCNTFGNNVYWNTFGNDFRYNTFGNSVGYNTFGNSVGSNTFGNNVYWNTFGNGVGNNTFGNGVQYFKYGTAGTTYDYMYYCYVESGVQNVYCYPQTTPTSSSMFQNVHIHSGLKGSSNTNRLILNNFSTNKDYVQHAEKDASGNYLIHWLGSYLTATGYYKNSITGTTWTAIPA